MKTNFHFLICCFLLTIKSFGQISTDKVREEIYGRAESFYNEGQYSQSVDLLERLNALKIPADFKSVHLKIKALSHVYTKDEKYFIILENSLRDFSKIVEGTVSDEQKVTEVESIRKEFISYRELENIAYQKAKSGLLIDQEAYLMKFPSSPHSREIRELKGEQSIVNKSARISNLEKELSDLKQGRKGTKGWETFNSIYGSAGLIAVIVSTISYFTNDEDNFLTKETRNLMMGAGAPLAIVGIVTSTSNTKKIKKIDRRINEINNELIEERKKIVYISPYSNFQLNGSVGLRISMKF